jgi:hypothetical protein
VLIQPPGAVPVPEVTPVVFLAGPIQGTWDWQQTASAKLACVLGDSAVIASPRRDYEQDGIPFVYETQVDWETVWLRRAARHGVVSFWLAAQTQPTPGRAYAQTSRFELGEWVARAVHGRAVRLQVGIEAGFGNERYIRRRLGQDLPQSMICDSLDDHLAAVAAQVASL